MSNYPMKLSDVDKSRWHAAAKGDGFASLAQWIRWLVEGRIEQSQLGPAIRPWPAERPRYGQRVMFWTKHKEEKIGLFVARDEEDANAFISRGTFTTSQEVLGWCALPEAMPGTTRFA